MIMHVCLVILILTFEERGHVTNLHVLLSSPNKNTVWIKEEESDIFMTNMVQELPAGSLG